jgi:predicted small secreted protein
MRQRALFGVAASPALTRKLFMRSKLAVAFIVLVVLGGASTILTACNTVEGAGKDVSKAGHEVSEEAREHK